MTHCVLCSKDVKNKERKCQDLVKCLFCEVGYVKNICNDCLLVADCCRGERDKL